MDVPKRHWVRYDGFHKSLTQDCDGCEWYRKIVGEELCGWGEAFKYLVKTENPRKCEVKSREQEPNPSVKYIDKILR